MEQLNDVILFPKSISVRLSTGVPINSWVVVQFSPLNGLRGAVEQRPTEDESEYM